MSSVVKASSFRGLLAFAVCGIAASAALLALSPEILTSTSAIPAEIAGRFREPRGFQQAASGQYFVFDRRGHRVYGVDQAQKSIWEIVQLGPEQGRILD